MPFIIIHFGFTRPYVIKQYNKFPFDRKVVNMKHFVRLLLLTVALAVGGGLGCLLIHGFDTVKMIVFFIACIVFGEVFYQIDKRISGK